MNIEVLKKQIIERLKPLNPYKVIIFGSYALGTHNQDSDIDLYVVTNDDYIPSDYKQSWEIKGKVYKALQDIRLEIPIDVIVHTKIMYNEFQKRGSSFAKDILTKGIILYGE